MGRSIDVQAYEYFKVPVKRSFQHSDREVRPSTCSGAISRTLTRR
jgi:hypothetical protein